jgi:radical SAM additional 4Fe4S-binding domain
LAIQKLGASINCVLTPANTDINASAEYIREKLGNVHFNFEGIMTHLGVQDSELIFTPELMLTLQRNIFKELTKNGWDKFPALTGKANEILLDLVQRRKVDPGEVKCGMNRENIMAINMNGDVLSCHDYATEDKYVGNISALEQVDLSKHFKSWDERAKCSKCLVLPFCRGACPQVEGLARTLTCKNEFNYHFAIFQAVWWLLFGLTLESYEPIQGE